MEWSRGEGYTGAMRSPLQEIPGVGPSIARDLERLGIRRVADLARRDPERMYRDFVRLEGRPVDRCLLYVFRCACYYARTKRPDPQKLLWWNWKDEALRRR